MGYTLAIRRVYNHRRAFDQETCFRFNFMLRDSENPLLTFFNIKAREPYVRKANLYIFFVHLLLFFIYSETASLVNKLCLTGAKSLP